MAIGADSRMPMKVFVGGGSDVSMNCERTIDKISMTDTHGLPMAMPCSFPPGLWPPPGLEQARPFSLADTNSDSTCAGSLASSSDREPEILHEVPDRMTLRLTLGNATSLTRDLLAETLDRHGLAGRYNLIYMPLCFETGAPFGFAVVNFTDAEYADLCLDSLHNFNAPDGASVEASVDCDQGYEALVEKFRNMAVMHAAVPDKFKPVAFAPDGSRVPFPHPTKRLRMPLHRGIRARKVANCIQE